MILGGVLYSVIYILVGLYYASRVSPFSQSSKVF